MMQETLSIQLYKAMVVLLPIVDFSFISAAMAFVGFLVFSGQLRDRIDSKYGGSWYAWAKAWVIWKPLSKIKSLFKK